MLDPDEDGVLIQNSQNIIIASRLLRNDKSVWVRQIDLGSVEWGGDGKMDKMRE